MKTFKIQYYSAASSSGKKHFKGHFLKQIYCFQNCAFLTNIFAELVFDGAIPDEPIKLDNLAPSTTAYSVEVIIETFANVTETAKINFTQGITSLYGPWYSFLTGLT